MFTKIRKFFRGLRELNHRVHALKKEQAQIIAEMTPDDATVCLDSLSQRIGRGKPATPGTSGHISRMAFIVFFVLALAIGGGCGGGLGAKTARDIETASDMILIEYMTYVEADPKLKEEQKQDRQQQVKAMRDVIRAAQK